MYGTSAAAGHQVTSQSVPECSSRRICLSRTQVGHPVFAEARPSPSNSAPHLRPGARKGDPWCFAILLSICSLTAFCVLTLPSLHLPDGVLMLFVLEFIFAELAVVLPGQWKGRRRGACWPTPRPAKPRLRLTPDRKVCSGAVVPDVPPGPAAFPDI